MFLMAVIGLYASRAILQTLGVAVNASRGIATKVNAAVGQFVSNFMMAMNPQITKSYAKGDYEYMHSLIWSNLSANYCVATNNITWQN